MPQAAAARRSSRGGRDQTRCCLTFKTHSGSHGHTWTPCELGRRGIREGQDSKDCSRWQLHHRAGTGTQTGVIPGFAATNSTSSTDTKEPWLVLQTNKAIKISQGLCAQERPSRASEGRRQCAPLGPAEQGGDARSSREPGRGTRVTPSPAAVCLKSSLAVKRGIVSPAWGAS